MKDEKGQDAPGLAVPVSERDHVRGGKDAAVTLVEYGDYECPYCGRAYPIIKRLREEMGERLRFVFRNFPLNTIHAHASVAAQAAEAAGAQGKFWEMHDVLYEHQDELAEGDMVRYALRAGVEIYKFEADLASEHFARRVKEDFLGGVRSGVNKTPTLFLNGRRYEGELEYGTLKEAIEGAVGET
jgi:protein-disulfide isomerase